VSASDLTTRLTLMSALIAAMFSGVLAIQGADGKAAAFGVIALVWLAVVVGRRTLR
jgi:hypothetical protein